MSGTLFFSADGGYGIGRELWKSSPLTGTVLVKNIAPDDSSSNPSGLANVSGTLYFLASDDQIHVELWKSDGSGAGTVRVADVPKGAASLPVNLINVNGTLYFSARNDDNRIELWKSDGTETGTVYVSDIGPIATDTSWFDYKTIGGKLFFAAEGGAYGRELFVLDPNAPPSADYNRDHVVDSADLDFWRHHFGETSGAGLQADGNGNSVVDAADFVTWRKKLGAAAFTGTSSAVQTDDRSVATNPQAEVLPAVAVARGVAPVAAEVADTKTRISNLEFSFPLTIKTRETHRAAPRPADANVINSVDNQNFMLIDTRDGTRGISSPVASQHPIRHKATDDVANDSVFSNDDLESMLIGCLVHDLDQDKLTRYSASNTTT